MGNEQSASSNVRRSIGTASAVGTAVAAAQSLYPGQRANQSSDRSNSSSNNQSGNSSNNSSSSKRSDNPTADKFREEWKKLTKTTVSSSDSRSPRDAYRFTGGGGQKLGSANQPADQPANQSQSPSNSGSALSPSTNSPTDQSTDSADIRAARLAAFSKPKVVKASKVDKRWETYRQLEALEAAKQSNSQSNNQPNRTGDEFIEQSDESTNQSINQSHMGSTNSSTDQSINAADVRAARLAALNKPKAVKASKVDQRWETYEQLEALEAAKESNSQSNNQPNLAGNELIEQPNEPTNQSINQSQKAQSNELTVVPIPSHLMPEFNNDDVPGLQPHAYPLLIDELILSLPVTTQDLLHKIFTNLMKTVDMGEEGDKYRRIKIQSPTILREIMCNHNAYFLLYIVGFRPEFAQRVTLDDQTINQSNQEPIPEWISFARGTPFTNLEVTYVQFALHYGK